MSLTERVEEVGDPLDACSYHLNVLAVCPILVDLLLDGFPMNAGHGCLCLIQKSGLVN